jgi:hypothetical protein
MQYERTGDYKRSTNYYDETATSLPYTLKSGDVIPIMNEMLIKGSTKVTSEFVEEEQKSPIVDSQPVIPGSNATLTQPRPGSNATATPELIPAVPIPKKGTSIDTSFVPQPVGSVKAKAQALQKGQKQPTTTNRGGKSKRLIRGPEELKKTMSVPRVVRSGTLRRQLPSNHANKTLKIHSLS